MDYHPPEWPTIETLLVKLGINPSRVTNPEVIDEKGNLIKIEGEDKKRFLLLELHPAILHSRYLSRKERVNFRMLIILYIYGKGDKFLPPPFTQTYYSDLTEFVEKLPVSKFLELLYARLGIKETDSIWEMRDVELRDRILKDMGVTMKQIEHSN